MEFHAKYSQIQFILQKSNKTQHKLKAQLQWNCILANPNATGARKCSTNASPANWVSIPREIGKYGGTKHDWHENVQNSTGNTSHGQEVSLQSFEHFDVISMVDKKEYRTWKIIVDWQFSCPFPLKFLEKIKCTRKRKINCATITSYQGPHSYQTQPSTNRSLRNY